MGVESQLRESISLAQNLQQRQVERRVEEVVFLVVLAKGGAFFLKLVFQPILNPRTSAEEEVVVGFYGALKDRILRVLDGRRQVSLLIVLAAGIEGKHHIVSVLAVVVSTRNATNPHHRPRLGTLLEFGAVITLPQIRNRNPNTFITLHSLTRPHGNNLVLRDWPDEILRNPCLHNLACGGVGGYFLDFLRELDIFLEFFVVVGEHEGNLLVALDVLLQFFIKVAVYLHSIRLHSKVHLYGMKLNA